LFGGLSQEALKPPTEVSGFADVRLAVTAQQEDGGRCGEGGEEGFVAVG